MGRVRAPSGHESDRHAACGDAICFHPGVLGADGIYGHIAVVENVGADGSITISEANARGIGVVNLRHISAMQLKAAGAGVAFIQ